MKSFQFIDAKSYREAVRLLRSHQGKARAMAGGTDLLGALKDRILPEYPEAIINLKSISGLEYIKQGGRDLKIGALAKLADVAASPVVLAKFPILAEAAHLVATPQVRNMATIGGNLCQESRCWYYRYPHSVGGRLFCYLKGGKSCYALTGENQYHSIFGGGRVVDPPCAQACPGRVEIGAYLNELREGNLQEAAAIVLKTNPIPAITGRVCPNWCEQECNRKDFDQSVAIRAIERFIGDYILEHATEIIRLPDKESGKKVAVVGSGPAGLAAAYYLRMAGHRVTVFDKMAEAGGMLTYGIPSYRLPRDIIRRTVDTIKKAGVEFRLNVDVGKSVTVEGLQRNFNALFLATGVWGQGSIGLDGEPLTQSGLGFLLDTDKGAKQAAGKKVLVIGGGNVAIDVGITALRLGAKEVTLACLERRDEMPAFPLEIEQALEEGVKLMPSWGPAKVLTADGRVTGMELVHCASVFGSQGRFHPTYDNTTNTTVEADVIIMAVGQATDLSFLGTGPQLKVERGLIVADKKTQAASVEGFFAGGEVTIGPASVAESIAAGRRAAEAINRYLGETLAGGKKETRTDSSFLKFNNQCLKKIDRVETPKIPVAQRGLGVEDAPGMDLARAEAEANRCFNCGCVAVSPSDTAVALMALNARIKIAGHKGVRVVSIDNFFTPAGKALEENEIVTEIQVPEPPAGARQAFHKFRVRKSVDFPIVSVASLLTVKNGACKEARIALGAVAPAPVRARAAEQTIKGKPIDVATAEAAAAAAVKDAIPLAKNGYKVEITRALVKRALLGED